MTNPKNKSTQEVEQENYVPSIQMHPLDAQPGDTITLTGLERKPVTIKMDGKKISFRWTRKKELVLIAPQHMGDGRLEIVDTQGKKITTSTGIFTKTVVTDDPALGDALAPSILLPPSDIFVSNISPLNGGVGTEITLTGAGFDQVSAVRIGGSTTQIIFNDGFSKIITKVLPGTSTGLITLTLFGLQTFNTGKTFTVSTGVTISGLNPGSGKPGDEITISGSNFSAPLTVQFAGVNSPNPILVNNTTIKAKVPAGAGNGLVTVTTPNGSASSPSLFIIINNLGPVISDFNPKSAAPDFSPIVITGSGFTGLIGVSFNGTVAASTFINDGRIEARVPLLATNGPITVTTTTGSTQSSVPFNVVGSGSGIPRIDLFSPAFGAVNSLVDIFGANFINVTQVTIGGAVVQNPIFTGTTKITAMVPPTALTGPITVTNNAGTGISTSNFNVTFTPMPPRVDAFSPLSGAAGQDVTIFGANFNNISSVEFGGVPASFFQVMNETQILTKVPQNAISGPITVRTPVFAGSSFSSFNVLITVQAPDIQNIMVTGNMVNITGVRLAQVSVVLFNGSPLNFNTLSDTSIAAFNPQGAQAGTYTVIAGNLSDSFMFMPANNLLPDIQSVSVRGTTATLIGVNFLDVTGVAFFRNNVFSQLNIGSKTDTRISVINPKGNVAGTYIVVDSRNNSDSFDYVPALPVFA